MQNYDVQQIERFAAAIGTDAAMLTALVAEVAQRVGATERYVFRQVASGGGTAHSSRMRRLIAFASPDTALAFAQQNQLTPAGQPVRLRRLTIAELLVVVVREPHIAVLVLADESDIPLPVGHLPGGVVLERLDILQRLSIDPEREEAHEQSL
ncbi:MAG TPA: hypothetical protein PKA05_01740 [Roseiflexaceae bacterium]|nr:hypothetical protein [Roseiflexaceae bacterium]HMP39078.1 hypothetical protein [Roseiflexaceae bacterium]